MSARFEQAFDRTMGHEGGYVCDPDDRGGETYKGISREYHPSWSGWRIIDAHKPMGHMDEDDIDLLNQLLQDHQGLQLEVEQFYRDNYWDPAGCPHLPDIIALELFDTAVNKGVQDAVRWMQQGLNALNRDGALFADLVDDGLFGPETRKAMNALPEDDVPVLNKVMNVLQGAYYINEMRRHPTQEKYARGWLKRVELCE